MRFTIGAGGGVKLFPSSTFGVRLNGQVSATFVHANATVLGCGNQTCLVNFNADVVVAARVLGRTHRERSIDAANQSNLKSSFSGGRCMPFSWYSSQSLAHGRSYMLGTLNGITLPATTGVARPSIG